MNISIIIIISGWKCCKPIRNQLYFCTKGYHLSVRETMVITHNPNITLWRKWPWNRLGNGTISSDLAFAEYCGSVLHHVVWTAATTHNIHPWDLRAPTQCFHGLIISFLLIHKNIIPGEEVQFTFYFNYHYYFCCYSNLTRWTFLVLT